MVKVKVFRGWLWFKSGFTRFTEKFEHSFPPSETQNLAMKIFEKAIFREDAELLIAPLSHTLYARVDDLFIIMDGRELRVINGKYQYFITLPEKTAFDLDRKFRRAMESRIKKMEVQVTSNVKKSLQSILEEISDQ